MAGKDEQRDFPCREPALDAPEALNDRRTFTELPETKKLEPNEAAALQELLGAKYGRCPLSATTCSRASTSVVSRSSGRSTALHAHAYALALKKITGVEVETMLPTPNIEVGSLPECQKYLAEGRHRRLYRVSPDD